MLQKFLSHTYARIRDAVAHHDVPVISAGMVAGFKTDRAAVLCKFHRIAQDIHQYFPDAHGISHHIGRFRYRQIGTKYQVPVGQEALHNAEHRIWHRRNINGNGSEFYFAAFNAADIQHIIDQSQQMIGAFADLLQTVFDFRLWIMLHGNIGKANDGIHRCSDVMGHIVQEGGLCAACILRGMDRVL